MKTKNRSYLEVARVKIWGYATKRINESITVSIEGKDFIIRISEESPSLGEEGDESLFSSSSERDDFQGGAVWEEDYSDAEEAGVDGRGIAATFPKDDFLELEKKDGVAASFENGLGMESDNCNYENGWQAAGLEACGSCGVLVCKGYCGVKGVFGG